MRKTMSLKQVEANRRNARKSTGPKSVNGKAVSRMNALVHGILSTEAVVHGRCIEESDAEFAALLEAFRADWEPVGVTEEMLVNQIATAHWRLRRVLRAESGEIALSVDKGQWERATQHPVDEFADWEKHGDPDHAMGNSVFGNFIQERKLQAVRAAVEQEGELTEATIRSVTLRGEPFGLTNELKALRSRLAENPEGLEPSALRIRQKERALAFIDEKLDFISWRKPECQKREDMEETARQRAAVLPSMDTLEKLSRYETKLERQMYRAMAQLERLQRMRQGEVVPPPMAVTVA